MSVHGSPDGSRFFKDALSRIPFRAVREDRHTRLARPEAARDSQGCRGRDSRGAAREEAFLERQPAAGLEGFRVADRDDLVDLPAVEDLGKEGQADALDRMRPLFSASEDRALRLGGDTEEARRELAQVARDSHEGPGRSDTGDEGV